MQGQVEHRVACGPSEAERAALVTLLADEDATVFEAVRDRLVSYGPAVMEWLRPHTVSRDPVLRRHARAVIRHLARAEADDRFLSFCLQQGEHLDLESGAWLLARTADPDISVEAYRALLDGFADELRPRLRGRHSARRVLAGINEYVFGELGFAGNEQDYYDPLNSYLHSVLDRRLGIPISLCVVYLLLGWRLRLPLAGVALPGHFICRYQSAAEEWFIDVFEGGRLLSKADCVHALLRGHQVLGEQYLTPASPRRILTRMCGNLHQAYVHLAMHPEATRVRRNLVALTR